MSFFYFVQFFFFFSWGKELLKGSAIAHLHACEDHFISYALSHHMQITFNNL